MKKKERLKTFCIIVCILICLAQLTSAQAAPKVRLNKASATVEVGHTITLQVMNSNNSVSWSSKNKSIATVSGKGRVKGIKAGKTTVSAKVGSKTLTCKITVKNSAAVSDKGASVTPAPYQNSASTVYMTTDISSSGMMKIYEALGKVPKGNVAVKLSTGEAGDTYYLSPDLIKELVQTVNGTIVECNTAYGGSRSNTAMHMQVAEDHGFTKIADVDIMDAEGSMSIPVTGGEHLKEDLVGAHLADYDFVVVLSHFKGHAMAGFGGALKNISIGIGSSEGKSLIHSAGTARTGIGMGTNQDDFLESMAEAAKAVSDYENGNMLYINVMNNLSVDCDCDSSPAAPTMADIGILASLDPVALDQACVDLVNAAPDGADLVERMESRNGPHILDYAAQIGLGSQKYKLVSIDD
ncbi:MAG TPA: DUF362 domain-containing protein [Mobilitalea sp.]|nr:DUF362 domain-containing protein [Mobilitalea sp.]